jgi:hypothetical protein
MLNIWRDVFAGPFERIYPDCAGSKFVDSSTIPNKATDHYYITVF